jgi:hypothetical protein
MVLKPDIIYKEISCPVGRWCDSGHVAPKEFRRGGAESLLEPTKFYSVSGLIDGIYCEPCLIVSNWIARKNKEKLKGE